MKKFLCRKEVAEMLGISLVTLHNHNKKGILKPSHKIGRKPLYLLEDVLAQIELSNPKNLRYAS
ncbi:helix-turn-helix domain-containing protein [Maribacter sp. PR1]|uniref:Helix-turn-helix domain-containing protein n=1 Tax=Maribacter cobaltidurans TaxID=1178778 RepID=A0ABU7IQU4_9FLAO|nr:MULTISPECIES: helix-turn-helix domain-containing protein [Maribacter]MDC6387539.1 helix-turn-helix domain-containing protein [Maribacter sp. PR1]MEE1974926.1 helix-turn-helix domain-containing protein [Maribacter cobaltidurans]